jgi:hypothetical protein
MRDHEIEAWTRDVIDRILAGQAIEDSRVELKRDLPAEHQKAARQIAGLLNAARGAHVLWLIGVDEKAQTVTGSNFADFAKWYQQVSSCFVELSPDVYHLNVPYEGKTVTAVLFPSNRVPFLVKTEKPDVFDVPYRTGTFTRSATRGQLLQILTPQSAAPKIEIITAWLTLTRTITSQEHWSMSAEAAFLVIQPSGSELAFPVHKAALLVSIVGDGLEVAKDIQPSSFQTVQDSKAVKTDLVVLSGTGQLRMQGDIVIDLVKSADTIFKSEATLSVSLTAATLETPSIGVTNMPGQSCSPTTVKFVFRGSEIVRSWGGVLPTKRMARR